MFKLLNLENGYEDCFVMLGEEAMKEFYLKQQIREIVRGYATHKILRFGIHCQSIVGDVIVGTYYAVSDRLVLRDDTLTCIDIAKIILMCREVRREEFSN